MESTDLVLLILATAPAVIAAMAVRSLAEHIRECAAGGQALRGHPVPALVVSVAAAPLIGTALLLTLNGTLPAHTAVPASAAAGVAAWGWALAAMMLNKPCAESRKSYPETGRMCHRLVQGVAAIALLLGVIAAGAAWMMAESYGTNPFRSHVAAAMLGGLVFAIGATMRLADGLIETLAEVINTTESARS